MSDEIKDWFTGKDKGNPVYESPHRRDDWDPLWVSLGDSPEIGRGLSSYSLTNDDLKWLRELLNRHLPDHE